MVERCVPLTRESSAIFILAPLRVDLFCIAQSPFLHNSFLSKSAHLARSVAHYLRP
jgi:hypothetical protein